jgi:hypothetical protein
MSTCGATGGRSPYVVLTSINDRIESLTSLLCAASLAERLDAELIVVDATRHIGLGAAVGLVPPDVVEDAIRAQRAYIEERVTTLLALTKIRWCLLASGGSRRALRRAVEERLAGIVIDMRPRRRWRGRRRQDVVAASIPMPNRDGATRTR